MPDVMVLGREASRISGRSGHEGEALMNGIGALLKEAPDLSLTPFTLEDTARGRQSATRDKTLFFIYSHPSVSAWVWF